MLLVGHVEIVKLLVSRSADKSCKDKQGYTPLHAAAASGHIEIVKYLLRMGAEVRYCCCLFFLNVIEHAQWSFHHGEIKSVELSLILVFLEITPTLPVADPV